MKWRIYFSVIFLVIFAEKLSASEYRSNPQDSVIAHYVTLINPDSIQSYMQSLEDFGTRFCLADNRREVASWIRDKFIEFGYTGAYLDSFQFNRWYNGVYYQTWQYNVIAGYNGYRDSDSVFVLGAHYDAIVPIASNPFANAPGADDNASGVAATLEIARVMKYYGYHPAYTILFMAFAAEELGLHGSKDYAQKAYDAGMNIICMINNDMVSYCTLPEEEWKVQIQKYPNSVWFTNLAHEIIQNHTILTAIESTVYIQYSDSWSFYQKGYSAIFFIEDQFTPFYHTVNDLVSTTNKYYAAEMTKISMGMLVHLNGLGQPPMIIPEELILPDTLISNGQEACFAATQSILVGGNGNAFTIENGGIVELISGGNILFEHETIIEPGAYMLARINPGGPFCDPIPLLALSMLSDEPEVETNQAVVIKPQIQIYPNPTTGRIAIEVPKHGKHQSLTIEIYSMLGERLFKAVFPTQPSYELDITGYKHGMYFVRVIQGQEIENLKVVKQ